MDERPISQKSVQMPLFSLQDHYLVILLQMVGIFPFFSLFPNACSEQEHPMIEKQHTAVALRLDVG